MPDSRIGRIHHPILEAGMSSFARSHRCRRRKSRQRLKLDASNEKWRERWYGIPRVMFWFDFFSLLMQPSFFSKFLHTQLAWWRGGRFGRVQLPSYHRTISFLTCILCNVIIGNPVKDPFLADVPARVTLIGNPYLAPYTYGFIGKDKKEETKKAFVGNEQEYFPWYLIQFSISFTGWYGRDWRNFWHFLTSSWRRL